MPRLQQEKPAEHASGTSGVLLLVAAETLLTSMVKAVEFWAATMESAESATTAVAERISADACTDGTVMLTSNPKSGEWMSMLSKSGIICCLAAYVCCLFCCWGRERLKVLLLGTSRWLVSWAAKFSRGGRYDCCASVREIRVRK